MISNMDDEVKETQAEKLYLKGADLERRNCYYDAIEYYRKAMLLVPDIDIRIFRRSKCEQFRSRLETDPVNSESTREDDSSDSDIDDEYDGTEPLQKRFNRILSRSSVLFPPMKSHKQSLHISDLPKEMISYILRWVISDELDLRSLEICALVCRGFYLCARDDQIWKSACLRIWKNNPQLKMYCSWREMFLNRPRVSTVGCYIGETKYYRAGENSFQDENYRPYHLAIYYRYLRFFADGTVLMVNTPDTPSQVVSQLKSKYSRFGPVVSGSYNIENEFVHLRFSVKRIRNPAGRHVKPKFINLLYLMTFQIKKFLKWNTKLVWKDYRITCSEETSFDEVFQLRDKHFPPLRHSRVRSYTIESDRPLP